ncbi:MAG TPA: S53 family peptidase [Pirellulales bacterium]|jgi:subtilase family serine protease|nr:S53 family peptidase [Pirellulales bacterium]
MAGWLPLRVRTSVSRQTCRTSPRNQRRIRLGVEQLEDRDLLAAGSAASPQYVVIHPASVNNPDPIGYTPAQIRAAYGFDQVSFTDLHGAPVAATGAGQTIAIIDAYSDPNIVADAATFNRQLGLPQFNQPNGPTLRVESQTGSTTALPATSPDWSVEIALDVEWAHAIAPGSNLLLVEANSDSFPDLLLSVNHAKVQAGVSVISMSWGGSEFLGETTWDSAFLARRGHAGETFVAAAGDDGSPPEWPAVSPYVLSVGGTTLNLTQTNGYASETGWSGSSGGVAAYEAEPAYQGRIQSTGWRASPDVAYDADPNTGMAVYDSLPDWGQSGWVEIGGTSAGAPQWAALIAVADQGRALKGLGPLSNAQSMLYSLPATDYHDITSGSNGGYSAGPAYDAVTGLGSPLANLVIQHLVSGVPAGSAAPVTGNTGVSGASHLVRGGRVTAALVVTESADFNAVISSIRPTSATSDSNPIASAENGSSRAFDVSVAPTQYSTAVRPGSELREVLPIVKGDLVELPAVGPAVARQIGDRVHANPMALDASDGGWLSPPLVDACLSADEMSATVEPRRPAQDRTFAASHGSAKAATAVDDVAPVVAVLAILPAADMRRPPRTGEQTR